MHAVNANDTNKLMTFLKECRAQNEEFYYDIPMMRRVKKFLLTTVYVQGGEWRRRPLMFLPLLLGMVAVDIAEEPWGVEGWSIAGEREERQDKSRKHKRHGPPL